MTNPTVTGGVSRPSLFICPVCGETLVRDEHGYACPRGHCFDRARSGYVNLISGKPPKLEGDTREMVAARSAFLDRGYYAPLRSALEDFAHRFCGGALLDAGCGEGYFLGNIAGKFPTAGIDLSKYAADAAAKRLGARTRESVEIAVASVYAMPLADRSVSLLQSVFAPYCGSEFRRLLPEGGTLVVAVPAAEHLAELKAVVYDAPPHPEPKEHALEGFALLREERITSRVALESIDDAKNLFRMTPHSRSASAHPERLDDAQLAEVTTAFDLAAYRRV